MPHTSTRDINTHTFEPGRGMAKIDQVSPSHLVFE